MAYVNHDLDDCIRSGVVTLDEVPADILNVLGRHHSARVGCMVEDLINASLEQPVLSMSPEVAQATDALKDFLYDQVYLSARLQDESVKVKGIVHALFDLYMTSDAALYDATALVPADSKSRARVVCDYIAGMTDRFARDPYLRHFLPGDYPPFESA